MLLGKLDVLLRKAERFAMPVNACQTFLHAFLMLVLQGMKGLLSAPLLRTLFFILLLFELPTELTIRSYPITKLDKDKRDRTHQKT